MNLNNFLKQEYPILHTTLCTTLSEGCLDKLSKAIEEYVESKQNKHQTNE